MFRTVLVIIGVMILLGIIAEPAMARARRPSQSQVEGGEVKHYLKVGGDPVYRNRPIAEGEMVQTISQDRWISTIDFHGRTHEGWIRKGTEVVTIATSDPTLRKAMWVRVCGNPILNPPGTELLFRVAPAMQSTEQAPAPVAPQHVVQQVIILTQPPPAPAKEEVVKEAPQPVAAATPVPAPPKTECRKKSGFVSTLVGAIFGGGAAILTRGNPYATGGATAFGSLVGSAVEGGGVECITVGDGVQAIVQGGVAGVLAGTRKSGSSNSSNSTSPGHTLPSNEGGHTLPVNGSGHSLSGN